MSRSDVEPTEPPVRRRTGRPAQRDSPPGSTRQAILLAARGLFSRLGYDRTSFRRVGEGAGVDPALVVHYFGSKAVLFAAAADLPFDAADVLPELLDGGDLSTVGERLADLVLGTLSSEGERARVVAMVRAAASDPAAAAMLRDRIHEELLLPLAEGVGGPAADASYRAALAMSQIVGLVMARHVVAIEPLVSADPERIRHDLAVTLQTYLVQDGTVAHRDQPRPIGATPLGRASSR